eukprot:TRINITY_DN4242_c0_g1_i4.p1 TRINITY_DN4242_c0_g1~~TRINITY_DN4242_c0_g1_i4.p1  ORF type:complete len:228 (-),score=52.49 TRINITY_DN4242_c0_g1_i4:76-759(-)
MAYHSLYPSLTPHVPPASAPSVPPPSPAVSLPLMQGWVSKLGDKGIRTWSKRYFILDHEGLSYHVDENNTAAPRGKITLADIVSVEHSTPSLLGGGQPTPPTVVSSFLAGNQRQIQSIMMMIFMKWQRDMALLYGASSADPYALFLLNMRIVARTASKINRALFPRLVDSLLELMSGLHARMPVHALYSGNVRTATPFPVLPAASNPHEEIVALCSMVNSSLTRHSQ